MTTWRIHWVASAFHVLWLVFSGGWIKRMRRLARTHSFLQMTTAKTLSASFVTWACLTIPAFISTPRPGSTQPWPRADRIRWSQSSLSDIWAKTENRIGLNFAMRPEDKSFDGYQVWESRILNRILSSRLHSRLCHNLTQLGYFRPSNRHAKYHNLYFTGASTHPGTGMPTAMVSGRLSAQRIMDDFASINWTHTNKRSSYVYDRYSRARFPDYETDRCRRCFGQARHRL